MDKKQAVNLIRQTFTQSFDKARFRNFAVNLLNHIDESKAFARNTQYIKNAFDDHVHRFERLGTYTSPENEKLDVLIVHLTSDSKLERARTAIRNFVADHLKTRDEKDAALVAFVSPSETTWRFSYVKMEYATVEKDSGKAGPEQSRRIGVETHLTPARRFSYIVGEGESCHTAQTRFLDLLQDTGSNPVLADIEEAFSVEAVTKEFFKKYAELFGKIHMALEELVAKDKTIRDEFKAKGVNTVDFAKKLMGQIVFLYFLQKKGWLGVPKGQDWGTGPHDFLRRLVRGDYGRYDNFFNDILEPLFYDTLATDRGHEAWCNRFKCRIPFLNGGLFEPLADYDWRRTDIILPNKLFTNSEFVEEGITGTGVLDVFDRYNFTVNEAEPLEKEVAIDPEMLGKVFENLIEENRRKGLGAYYTPREIVHYMCQESLINYLDTSINTPKENVPRADLETFVHLGDQISHYEAVDTRYVGREMPKQVKEHAKLIDEKLSDITVCDPAVGSGAFPVGMMTEIVRARCALTPYFNDVHERTPYHFKRHAIQNCLYGVDIDPGAVEIAKLRLWLSLVVDEEDVKQIKPLPNLDYKIVSGNSLLGVEKTLFNEKLFQQLEKLKPVYFDESYSTKKALLRHQIDDLIHKLTNGKETFDFEIYFSEVFHKKGGFDVLIGNPPYGAEFSSEQRVSLLRAYKHQSSPPESYMLFVEKGHSLIRQHGVISYIVPNTWLPSLTFKKFRRFLTSQFQWRSLLIVQTKVFAAVVDTNVFIFKKRTPTEGSELPIFFFGPTGLRLAHQLPWDEIPKNGDAINVVFPPSHQNLFQKIKKNGVLLKNIANVFNGVKPFEKGKGKPPQTAQTIRDKPFVVEGSKPAGAHWMPLLRGSLIQRYVTIWNNDSWIKYGEWLAASRDPAIFEAPVKLFVRQTGDSIIATLGKSGFVARNNLHIILPKISTNLLFVLGVLNSKTMDFVYCFINPEKGETLAEVKKNHVEELPLPKVAFDDPQKQKSIIALVDRILAVKQRDVEADTSALEQEIDQLVYQLYDLTPEEIQIVEGAAK
jgi:type I restriction-modification system DNA methylase subunit